MMSRREEKSAEIRQHVRDKLAAMPPSKKQEEDEIKRLKEIDRAAKREEKKRILSELDKLTMQITKLKIKKRDEPDIVRQKRNEINDSQETEVQKKVRTVMAAKEPPSLTEKQEKDLRVLKKKRMLLSRGLL